MPDFHPESPAWWKKASSTVLPEILSGVLFFTAVSVVPPLVERTTGYALQVNSIMLGILGTILAFAISLRTSTANDRYQEGRRAWSGITLASRNLAFLFWLHLPPTTLDAAALADLAPEQLEIEKVKGMLEKRTYINLVEAFAVSVKHYLRGESGVFYEDLYHLCACLPKYSFPSSVTENSKEAVLGLWRSPGESGDTYLPADPCRAPPPLSSSVSTATISDDFDVEKGEGAKRTIDLLPAYNPPTRTLYHYVPPLLIFRPFVRFFTHNKDRRIRAQKGPRRRPHTTLNSNVPLEIHLFLSGYVNALMRRKTLDGPMVSVLFAPLGVLQESFTTLERVLTTPLPFASRAHLRFSVYIYLLLLPFQIYATLGWLSVVGTCVAAIVFLGFLELGNQLEQPFGFDESDLDLDHFCKLIRSELHEIVAHPQPDPADFVFSPLNRPFHGDSRTASEILKAVSNPVSETPQDTAGVPQLRKLLAKHYHEFSSSQGEDKVQEKNTKKSKRQLQSVDVFRV